PCSQPRSPEWAHNLSKHLPLQNTYYHYHSSHYALQQQSHQHSPPLYTHTHPHTHTHTHTHTNTHTHTHTHTTIPAWSQLPITGGNILFFPRFWELASSLKNSHLTFQDDITKV